jgi:hypothetical protein
MVRQINEKEIAHDARKYRNTAEGVSGISRLDSRTVVTRVGPQWLSPTTGLSETATSTWLRGTSSCLALPNHTPTPVFLPCRSPSQAHPTARNIPSDLTHLAITPHTLKQF